MNRSSVQCDTELDNHRFDADLRLFIRLKTSNETSNESLTRPMLIFSRVKTNQFCKKHQLKKDCLAQEIPCRPTIQIFDTKNLHV